MASKYDTRASVNLLKNIRELDDFYDVTLVAGLDGKKFNVHRIIMAASNRYFNVLLGPNFKETQQNEVVLHEIDGSTLKTVIDYCYCCKIEINYENVHDIMAAASRMEFLILAQHCENFYLSKLRIKDCLKTLALADTYNLKRLWKESLHLACETFSRLSEADLMQIDQRHLRSILKQKMIDAPEDLVAFRLAQWGMYDKNNHGKNVHILAKWIRLEHISEAMSTAMKLFYRRYGSFRFIIAENRKRNKTPTILYRVSDSNNSLYAVEIIYYDATKNRIALHEYDEESKTFRKLYESCFGGDVDNMLFLRGYLYVLISDSVRWYSLNVVTEKKESLPDLPFRSHCSPVIVGSYLYLLNAFGPFANHPRNFARYDIDLRRWENLKSFPLEFHDLTAIELNNLIYVAGEMPPKNFHLSNFWCYDPADNSWTQKARINTVIKGGKHLIKANNFICLINYNMDTAMVYDAGSNKWNVEDLKKNNKLEQRLYQTAQFRGRTFGILSCNRKHYCVHLEVTAKGCKAKVIGNPYFSWTNVGVFVYNKSMREKNVLSNN